MKELRILATVLACLCIFVVVGCSSEDSTSSDTEKETTSDDSGGPVPEGGN